MTEPQQFDVGEIAIHMLWGDVTIVGPLEMRDVITLDDGLQSRELMYLIDAPAAPVNPIYGYQTLCAALPQDLRKKYPPFDEPQAGSWDQCPWSPAKVLA
jgi:hypothetical protein